MLFVFAFNLLPSISDSLSCMVGMLIRVCFLSLKTTNWSFPLDFSISFLASDKDIFSVTVPLIWMCKTSRLIYIWSSKSFRPVFANRQLKQQPQGYFYIPIKKLIFFVQCHTLRMMSPSCKLPSFVARPVLVISLIKIWLPSRRPYSARGTRRQSFAIYRIAY